MSAWEPIGDPTGGPAYGEFNDPVTAVVGGSLISGVMGANAARGAADTQAGAARDAAAAQLQASREANDLQWRMYQQGQQNQAPYLQAGGTALAALQSGLGLGRSQGLPSVTPGGGGTTTTGATNPDGTPASYGLTNYGPASADTNAAADAYAGKFTETFKPNDLYTDPSYQWRLTQGTQNLNSSAAARGMLGSGQNLKDITNYGQEAASQEYQNAYNRFNTNQTNLYNRISALAGMGQNTAVGMGAAGTAAAAQMGQNTMTGAANASNYLTSGASAQAAGQVGQANAYGGAFNTGAQGWMQMQYLNKFSPVTTTPTDMTGFSAASSPITYPNPAPGLGSGLYTP
jgi:hypothetical protein